MSGAKSQPVCNRAHFRTGKSYTLDFKIASVMRCGRPMKKIPTKIILFASLIAVVCLFSAQHSVANPSTEHGPTIKGPGADDSVRQDDGGKKKGPKKKGGGKKKKGGGKKE